MSIGYPGELFAVGIISAALLAIPIARFTSRTASYTKVLGFGVATVLATAIPRSDAAQPIDVKDAWLKRDCMDKGNSDQHISKEEFEACVRKQIESLPPLDKNRRELFGEQYDPSKYLACRTKPGNRANSACNVYVLRRREWPEFWPEGAKRIKWPDAPKDSVYRKGMKPREYWEALCKAEAGEFVARTVNEIRGVFGIRPRSNSTDLEKYDRNVLEGAFLATDILDWNEPEHALVQPYGGRYDFLERRGDKEDEVLQIARIDPSQAKERWQTGREGKFVTIPMVLQRRSSKLAKSTHGYTWRGISRERDRENGISGGEMIVVDLRSGEILGIRRGFALSGQGPTSRVNWATALRCPSVNSAAPNAEFVYRILRPRTDANDSFRSWER